MQERQPSTDHQNLTLDTVENAHIRTIHMATYLLASWASRYTMQATADVHMPETGTGMCHTLGTYFQHDPLTLPVAFSFLHAFMRSKIAGFRNRLFRCRMDMSECSTSRLYVCDDLWRTAAWLTSCQEVLHPLDGQEPIWILCFTDPIKEDGQVVVII